MAVPLQPHEASTGRHAEKGAPVPRRPQPRALPRLPTSSASGGRVAWTVPVVLGVVGGILLGLGIGWGSVALLAGLLLAWSDARPLLAAAALLGSAAGFGSVRMQAAQADPITPWIGAQVTLTGDWDGQFLTLSDPRARLAVAPKPGIPAGRVTLSGRLVRPDSRRIPGGFDQAAWLRSQGGLFLPTPTAILVAARVRSSTPEHGLRGWFRRGLITGLGVREAALMEAVELGDRNDIGQEKFAEGYGVRDAFNRAGLAHLMALSGQNVALITGVLIWLLTRLGARPAWRYGVPAALLIPYSVQLVGFSPSITRAVIMGIAVMIGLAVGRGKPDSLGITAFAALACLLPFPMWLLDVGFQLSFLAVLALLLSGKVADLLPRQWPMWIRLALVATVLAELGTLPIIASTFGQIPLVGLPANLLAGAVMVVLVPLGFLAGLLGPAAILVNWLVSIFANMLLLIAETFGRAPVLSWGTVSAAGYLAYALAAGAGVLWLRGRIRAPAALGTVLACMVFTALPPRLNPPHEIVFLDVGQGDSTLIRLPGFTALIDAGGSVNSDYDVGGRTVVPALRALGVRKLDLVVATHADTDHIEGISGVLRGLPVGELWIGQLKTDDPVLTAVLLTARERRVPVREVRRGDQLKVSGLTLNVLWPPGNVWSTADNDNSVSMTLEVPTAGGKLWRTAILGDLADPAEAMIGLGHLDLLKAAHHGSRFSSGAEMLAQTHPADVLISVGRNTYGHPHPAVLARIEEVGAKVWRTDQLGTVRWPLP
ncbi:DNA internalization-related competence protein ComEC/Rec2 [Deinococcus oregonensis]|uniref:DNA internalization-related competence protein ComEC/Rec2 n=1 Tax=Deinococcus oregonensis TaxID=1805970 RepID=A0ABV6B0Y2_9DEIO